MNPYDQIPGHPLAGVPDVVLLTARTVLHGCAGIDPNESDDAADAVVQGLREGGYVTWPGRAPDRESLVLAVFVAIAHAVDDDGDRRSTAEVAVDALLPLIRQLTGTSPDR